MATSPTRNLFRHQEEALISWEANGRIGILEHATGSGKTVTALHAIRQWLVAGRPALVLVPSALLLKQWDEEASREFSDLGPSILLAGDGHESWNTSGLLRLHTQVAGDTRVVIATMQTAASDRFRRQLVDGAHLMVVADEAHRLGAPLMQSCLPPLAGGRLALSATPTRAGDPAGTKAIVDYFGPTLSPVFTLADAIAAGRLTPYAYYPHRIALDDDEAQRWKNLTVKIRRLYARHASSIREGGSNAALDLLLINRARIAKQAAAKVAMAVEVVSRGFTPGAHWLVYCDDQRQLGAIRAGLASAGIDALEYHSAMRSDRVATMDRFRLQGGVLTSIRCLDEGVDIPQVSHAVIVASSRNPREFIQRRGRVLRTAPRKTESVIHDLLVLPRAADDRGMLDGLVLGELARANVFARTARNGAASAKLRRWCVEMNVNPDLLASYGVEATDGDMRRA